MLQKLLLIVGLTAYFSDNACREILDVLEKRKQQEGSNSQKKNERVYSNLFII